MPREEFVRPGGVARGVEARGECVEVVEEPGMGFAGGAEAVLDAEVEFDAAAAEPGAAAVGESGSADAARPSGSAPQGTSRFPRTGGRPPV